ncbi:MAG: pyridoxal phosphate-dependent decarboxylase family protein [Acidobacteriota bacterium]
METKSCDLTLELSPGEMRGLVEDAMDRIVPFIESLPRQPAQDTEGAVDLARSLIEPLPRKAEPFSDLLDLLFERLIPKTFNAAGPGYLAYIPGGGVFHTAVADLISDAVNRYVGVAAAAPALAQLEANVIRWFSQIMGYSSRARGFLTTGGSLANFSAIVTARRQLLPENFLSGTLYVSDQTHHSVLKAALMAGFPRSNVREIESDDQFKMRADLLQERIEEDRTRGLSPFLIVASAGTTNTGAVDDLETLAQVARAGGLWLHVDAAYGGFFMLTRRGRDVMKGIEEADSITLDPHKGLFLPYGTGSLLVRDGEALRKSHSVHASYMPPIQQDPLLVDFCEISPELSRAFRGLRVWLPVKLHGIEPFRRNLDEKLDLTDWALQQLRRIDGIEIVTQPYLTVIAFRYSSPEMTLSSCNQINRLFLDAINRRKRVYLTPTTLNGKFVIRICVLSFRTHMDRMEACLEDIRGAMSDIKTGRLLS